jgi:hypothetical protein
MMLTSILRTIDPTFEPVTVAQAKAQSRVTVPDDDALIAIYVKAAREYVEAQTNRALLQQTWRASYSHFPRRRLGVVPGDGFGCFGYGLGGFYAGFGGAYGFGLTAPLTLPRPRLIGIVSVEYFDINGNQQTLDPSQYTVQMDGEPATLSPVYGAWWPFSQPYRPDAVQVTYTCGYGTTCAAVPADLQLAILMIAAHSYENREASVLPTTGTGPVLVPLGVDAMLAPYTLPLFTYGEG